MVLVVVCEVFPETLLSVTAQFYAADGAGIDGQLVLTVNFLQIFMSPQHDQIF